MDGNCWNISALLPVDQCYSFRSLSLFLKNKRINPLKYMINLNLIFILSYPNRGMLVHPNRLKITLVLTLVITTTRLYLLIISHQHHIRPLIIAHHHHELYVLITLHHRLVTLSLTTHQLQICIVCHLSEGEIIGGHEYYIDLYFQYFRE